MLTISSFYLASQSMWLDSSIQAVAQRDASMFVGEIGRRIEAADRVDLPDATHLLLYLEFRQTASITWDPGQPGDTFANITDIVDGNGPSPAGRRTDGSSRSNSASNGPNPRIVYLDSLRIEMPSGEALVPLVRLRPLQPPVNGTLLACVQRPESRPRPRTRLRAPDRDRDRDGAHDPRPVRCSACRVSRRASSVRPWIRRRRSNRAVPGWTGRVTCSRAPTISTRSGSRRLLPGSRE